MAVETRGTRLPAEIFDLPVEKMREGYYTDAYFNHTRETLLRDGRHPRVVMQVFQRNQAMLGGVDEAIAILKLCSEAWDALTVHALHDGDRIEPWETAMTRSGRGCSAWARGRRCTPRAGVGQRRRARGRGVRA